MMYHCLRKPGAPVYPGEEQRQAWEATFIKSVCHYLEHIVAQVQPTKGVFVAVDGVVPMAKIRQQRLRRFKSPWIAEEERRLGKPGSDAPRWNTNALTPGTAFMESLGAELVAMKKRHPSWTISTSSEPGEGEQKCMDALRKIPATVQKGHVVYGLDADLILLSLLQQREKRDITLFREAVECGEVQYSEDGQEEYRYFSVSALASALMSSARWRGLQEDFLLQYCMAMSFLGNDFLPHGLTFTLRGEGHEQLLKALPSFGTLVSEETGWTQEGLKAILSWLASNEEHWLRKALQTKAKLQHVPAKGTGYDLVYDEWFKTPLRVFDERCLISSFEQDAQSPRLRRDWQEVYDERYLHGAQSDGEAQRTYLQGLDWIYRYYTGKPISYDWMYPWHVPPTWASFFRNESFLYPHPSPPPSKPLKPQEQLALVIPLSSWGLLRDPVLQKLPSVYPSLWPSSFKLQMAGKRAMWECEAMIPLFTPERLRSYVASTTGRTK